jgi:hypothetical protein
MITIIGCGIAPACRFSESLRRGLARDHQTLRVTPAMEAGMANRVWSVEEIVGLPS